MPPASSSSLIAYADWATARLLRTAAALDEAAWAQTSAAASRTSAPRSRTSSAPTGRGCTGGEHTSPPAVRRGPTRRRPKLSAPAHDDTAMARRVFLAALTPADLARPCAYTLSVRARRPGRSVTSSSTSDARRLPPRAGRPRCSAASARRCRQPTTSSTPPNEPLSATERNRAWHEPAAVPVGPGLPKRTRARPPERRPGARRGGRAAYGKMPIAV